MKQILCQLIIFIHCIVDNSPLFNYVVIILGCRWVWLPCCCIVALIKGGEEEMALLPMPLFKREGKNNPGNTQQPLCLHKQWSCSPTPHISVISTTAFTAPNPSMATFHLPCCHLPCHYILCCFLPCYHLPCWCTDKVALKGGDEGVDTIHSPSPSKSPPSQRRRSGGCVATKKCHV